MICRMKYKRAFQTVLISVLLVASHSYPLRAQTPPVLTPQLYLPIVLAGPSGSVSGFLYANDQPLSGQKLTVQEYIYTFEPGINTVGNTTTDSMGFFNMLGNFASRAEGLPPILYVLQWNNEQLDPNLSGGIRYKLDTFDPALKENRPISLGRIHADELVLQSPISGTTVTLPMDFVFTVPPGQPECRLEGSVVISEPITSTFTSETGRFTITEIREEVYGQPGSWSVFCSDLSVAPNKWTYALPRDITITRTVNE